MNEPLDNLTLQLKHELLDLFESEYFQSTLYEVLQSSFNYCIKTCILTEIYQ